MNTDWEIKRENIEIEKIIGKGSFGQVAKGILKDHEGRMERIVAIKMIKGQGLRKMDNFGGGAYSYSHVHRA